MRRILAVVAHPDDEIIGVGGTLCRHQDEGDEVAVLILGEGKSSRKPEYAELTKEQHADSDAETRNALAKLGIATFWKHYLPDNRFDQLATLDITKRVSDVTREWKPEVIYTHHPEDLNVDHRACAEAVLVASRPVENPCVREVYSFETLSSTESSDFIPSRTFVGNVFVDISAQLERKLDAMSCYASELREYPHPRSLTAIRLNAELRGAKCNTGPCEALCLLKLTRPAA